MDSTLSCSAGSYGGCRFALHSDPGGFERGFGLRQFRRQALGAVAADGVADFRERLTGNLFDFANFFSRALRDRGRSTFRPVPISA